MNVMRGGYKSKKILFFIILLFVIIQVITIIGMAEEAVNTGNAGNTGTTDTTDPNNAETDTPPETDTTDPNNAETDTTDPNNAETDTTDPNNAETDTPRTNTVVSLYEDPLFNIIEQVIVTENPEKALQITPVETPLDGGVATYSDPKLAYVFTFALIHLTIPKLEIVTSNVFPGREAKIEVTNSRGESVKGVIVTFIGSTSLTDDDGSTYFKIPESLKEKTNLLLKGTKPGYPPVHKWVEISEPPEFGPPYIQLLSRSDNLLSFQNAWDFSFFR